MSKDNDNKIDIENIEKIEVKSIRVPRKDSLVINNFYSLITIIIMCVVILWYTNYILPQQKIQAKKQEKLEKYKDFLKEQNNKREEQIKLSQKLNKRAKDINVTK
ncbi:MAG TPA: hypothetical protein EYG97_00985 [Arcobacter sp.]|nr:hypothetical protein [Arcobacter sp.]HIP55578.1 hypothetical protein [Arcobacter sp.]